MTGPHRRALTHTQPPATGQPCRKTTTQGERERETERDRERQSGELRDRVTAKSKRFCQNLRMMKLKDDIKLSKECKKKRGKMMKGPG